MADDLFLDSLFSPTEKVSVDSVEVDRSQRLGARPELIRRMARVHRAKMQRCVRLDVTARYRRRFAVLTGSLGSGTVVLPHPQLAPAGVVYAMISGIVAVLARREPRSGNAWAREDTTRHMLGSGRNRHG